MNIYEEIADLCQSTIGLGAVPREVIIQLVKEAWPDPQVARENWRTMVEQSKIWAANLPPGAHIAYDADELERVRETQRKLK